VWAAPGDGVAASFSCAAFTAPGSGAGTASFSSAMEEDLAWFGGRGVKLDHSA
jgi:hypothetical protein